MGAGQVRSSRPAPDGLTAALETLWQKVLEDPADEERHRKFVAFAVEQELYRAAIERYSTLAANGGPIAQIAEKQKKNIGAQAAAKAFAKAATSGPRQSTFRSRMWWSLLIGGVAGILLSGGDPTSFWLSLISTIVGVAGVFLNRART